MLRFSFAMITLMSFGAAAAQTAIPKAPDMRTSQVGDSCDSPSELAKSKDGDSILYCSESKLKWLVFPDTYRAHIQIESAGTVVLDKFETLKERVNYAVDGVSAENKSISYHVELDPYFLTDDQVGVLISSRVIKELPERDVTSAGKTIPLPSSDHCNFDGTPKVSFGVPTVVFESTGVMWPDKEKNIPGCKLTLTITSLH